ncbi:SDR family NAD(P)-dependent oxidoreductase [Natrarchaeobius oligotrophus]|uniref:SDR family oxidoreductase n=1 Tax=Natrarchaeobius chitinivorans TaxID=1679083 RepID=A0A3N6M759_NATCH|nr:SDR family NAD(P)-dependent oxidoreductase [Natrarchaeobius chitinivorans]RQG99448.1 SDR family oxidoreductase [Natrarchaeobius chitinivorans]
MSDRAAVVTGGAVGIGREISETLAADGFHVVVFDVQDAAETIESIREAGGSAEYRRADVTNEESLEEAFDGLSVDVLVNNAGYFEPLVTDKKRFDEIEREEWERVFDVNVTGVFLTSKAAITRMSEGGSIVNISSNVAVTGVPGFLHYVASKAAVLGLTRSMATELGDDGIRVNAVMPGLTTSPASLQAGEEFWDAIVDQQDLDRRVTPSDIASAVSYLATEESGIVTGQALNVDGGFVNY